MLLDGKNMRSLSHDWQTIERRLRQLGVTDAAFDADFDEQVERAVARFTAVQEQRKAAGLDTIELPEDPRVLVSGRKPWWTRSLSWTSTNLAKVRRWKERNNAK